MIEPVDLQGCECCPREFPIETMTMMDDCWFCDSCTAEFRRTFDACEHQWEPHTDSMGDRGRYCVRCSGFVMDELA